MALRRWFGAVGQRVLLFLLAGITTVFILHIPAGITPAKSNQVRDSFVAARWAGAASGHLADLAHGDLGSLKPLMAPRYMQSQPVAAVLRDYLGNSMLLLLLSLALSLVGGTLAGLLASRFGPRWFRGSALTGTLLLLSTPDILLILLLRSLVVGVMSSFGVKLFSLTALGFDPQPSHFIAPLLALSALPMALVARISAVAFDEVYSQLYIRTAVAKGLHPLRVIWKHALKNAWLRVAEAGPLVISPLMTGLVVVEFVLYFPGIGRTLGLLLSQQSVLGFQPGPASTIALTLLAAAFLVETALAAIRTGLDPRLQAAQTIAPGAAEGPERRSLIPRLLAALAGLPGALAGLPGALAGWRAEQPERWRQALWAWRPRYLLRAIWQNPQLLAGLMGVGVLTLVALFGGQFVDLSTAHRATEHIVFEGEVLFRPYAPGLPGYPLGSDMMGRSVASRLLIGARYTLFFTLAVTPVRFLIALPWGLLAGLRGGLWAGSGRTAALMTSAMPVILVPAALLPLQRLFAGNPGSGLNFWLITAILAAVGVPRLVETIRQQSESVAIQPFVEGATAVGASDGRILRRHILPHLMPQLWVTAAADMAWTLLLLAQFGLFSIFLGGTAWVYQGETPVDGVWLPSIPDWSSMLSTPYEVIYRAPWSLWFPSLAFLLAIIAFNLVAEGLRRGAQQTGLSMRVGEGPNEGRRLALEWAPALIVLLALTGATVRYGFQTVPAYVTAQPLPELERSRLVLQATLETATGTAGEQDRNRALLALPKAGVDYLQQAQKAGLTAAEIQSDSRGLFTMLESGEYRMAALYVAGGPGSYLFLQDQRTGETSYARSVERPTSFAVITGPERRHLLVAGTVPGSGADRWVISLFTAGQFRPGLWAPWEAAPGTARDLAAQVPAGFQVKLVATLATARLEQTLGPLANTKVAPDGAVTLCKAINRDCVSVDWRGEER